MIQPPSIRGHPEQNVQPERSSDPRPECRCTRSRFRSVDCACHILTQKPKPSLGSRLPCSYYCPTSPPVVQSRTTMQHSACPPEEKHCPLGLPQKPQMRINGARHSAVPQIFRLTWALMPFLTQPKPGPPGPTQTAGRTLSTSDPPWP